MRHLGPRGGVLIARALFTVILVQLGSFFATICESSTHPCNALVLFTTRSTGGPSPPPSEQVPAFSLAGQVRAHSQVSGDDVVLLALLLPPPKSLSGDQCAG